MCLSTQLAPLITCIPKLSASLYVERTSRQMNVLYEWTDEWTEEWTDGPMNGPMNGPMDQKCTTTLTFGESHHSVLVRDETQIEKSLQASVHVER